MPSQPQASRSVSADLLPRVREAIAAAGGWLPFDRYMAMALYEPGLGYYAHGSRKFGLFPGSGSDFVTAPELSPLFGRALAVQVAQGLAASTSGCVMEFGAGSGALAEQLLDALGDAVHDYAIVDLSGSLRARQQQRLARFAPKVRWLEALPDAIEGVVVGNEVLDAMPVQLIAFDGARWQERGVAWQDGRLVFQDRPSTLQPPVEAAFAPGTVTELHLQARAFIATLAERMTRGLAILVDYGFPEAEYYHPQRHGGTLMCHRAHRADDDPLADPGEKDITAHVDFTAIALAAQEAGADVLGYTSQAHFLVNCGLPAWMAEAEPAARAAAHKLVAEHEMGELFKVIALGRGITIDPVGFAVGDRMHRL
jgi:SAM-dependent MidA family methyltransferase